MIKTCMKIENSHRLLLITFAFLLLSLFVAVNASAGCFTIIVGKDASADGSVLVAHNEDAGPPVIVNHYKIPRKTHPAGSTVELMEGGYIEQVPETYSYIWSEIPDLYFSDSFVNEWGVCITSNACPSREDRPEFSDGGISKMLRHILIQRSKTAREAIELAGELVERFGYDSSGRTYTICDPDEGWLFAVVHGRHWLAHRVPDDQVAMIANVYSIREVDLNDYKNVIASDDILSYASKRGWLNPEDGFDFAATYAHRQALADTNNFGRQWSGLCQVTDERLKLNSKLPSSLEPNRKLDVTDMMKILRNHHEGTDLDLQEPSSGSPHQAGKSTICSWATQTSFIAQLRSDLPREVGLVYWACLGSPCISCYTPFCFGIDKFPEGFALDGDAPTLVEFRQNAAAPFTADSDQAFWTFINFYHKVDARHAFNLEFIRSKFDLIEADALAKQKQLEVMFPTVHKKHRANPTKLLREHSREIYLSTISAMDEIIQKLK
ncbi:hypothetical protein CEE37_00875 [candidate division LCP-89 bacterium B3_LCP]|uniref:Dipeptidase n=1 Tax=candidate division LCP-89 bacterium B3_LCP TaxID=2012998 RepID=A0A532V4Y5_UNCL8|nr:MAG: hypothetical protein CEE37_00875 [candidate division LCP-89 bacterium B3_LCP]